MGMRTFLLAICLLTAGWAYAGTLPESLEGKVTGTKSGMVNLYTTRDSKIYVGLPLCMTGKCMMMGTMVERCSDPMESSAGYQPSAPVAVRFEMADSSVFLCRDNETWLEGNGKLAGSHIPSVLESFRIEGYANDSSEVIFDATSFFTRSDKSTDPVDPNAYNGAGGLVKRTSSYQSENTYISGCDVFDDNFSISVCHTYRLKAAFLGVFSSDESVCLTTEIRRTFVLLPQDKMPLKKSDDRIGTYSVRLDAFGDSQRGSRQDYFAVKWRMETDSTGRTSSPVCFYIDNAFPESWVPYIKSAVKEWNEVFRKAGFENALTCRMYPEDSVWFSPANIKYSCIRYNFSMSDKITDSRLTDPRTGEILSAGIYVNSGICESIRRDLLLQTAASKPDSRKAVIPEALFGSILKTKIMRSIGHCLGLADNMAGSFAYSPDSLKHAVFTDTHGLSASVMDDLPLNFIGYSGDVEGNRLPAITQDKPGPYDCMAIEWLYGTTGKDLWKNRPDPEFEYGKKQSAKSFYDPRAMALDLGNDFVKAAEYGMEGLANAVAGMNTWLDAYDCDYSIRNRIQESIILQAYEYIKQVFVNLGGIYLYPKYDGETICAYRSVPAETQRECLLWAMERIEDLSFLDNACLDADRELGGITSDFCQKYFSRFIFMQIDAMWLSEVKSEETAPYTQTDAMEDVNRFIWKEAVKGKPISDLRKYQQITAVDYLLSQAGLQGKIVEDVHKPDRTSIWYNMLGDISKILGKAERKSRVQEDKDHYAYLSYIIRKAYK